MGPVAVGHRPVGPGAVGHWPVGPGPVGLVAEGPWDPNPWYELYQASLMG